MIRVLEKWLCNLTLNCNMGANEWKKLKFQRFTIKRTFFFLIAVTSFIIL